MTHMAKSLSLGVTAALVMLMLVAAGLSCERADAKSEPKGHRARGCGFDLNFNGVIGEPADCQVCRGGATNADIDANGIHDRQVYVQQEVGTDNTSCGSPGLPCRTARFAIEGHNTSFPDRLKVPSTGQIQALCVAGTGQPDALNPPIEGAVGAYVRAATGSQARPFEYPRYPLMIVGWDKNANGIYPPFDPEDSAVFDGNLVGRTERAFDTGRSRVELAHLTIRDYGLTCPSTEYVTVSLLKGTPSHVYVHDVTFSGHSLGCGDGSNGIVIETYTGTASHIAIENNLFDSIGGFIIHRGSAARQSGPIRFQRNTYACTECESVFKVWGLWSGIEVIDNVLNGFADTNPKGMRGITAAQCTQDWTIANNTIQDFRVSLIRLQPSANGACASRPVDGVVIDRNVLRRTAATGRGADAIRLEGQSDDPGDAPMAYIGQTRITNNFISTDVARWQAAILIDGGHNDECSRGISGAYEIVNNTISMEVSSVNFAPGVIRFSNFHGSTCRQQNIVLRNNILAGTAPDDYLVYVDYEPTAFVANHNVYASEGRWRWNATDYRSLEAWQSVLSGVSEEPEPNSRRCAPMFLGPTTGNFRLAPSDTCALDAGMPQPAMTSIDIDGKVRPQRSAWDVGAHEVAGVVPRAPVSRGTASTPRTPHR